MKFNMPRIMKRVHVYDKDNRNRILFYPPFNFINGMKSNGRKDKKESIDGEKGLCYNEKNGKAEHCSDRRNN